jgi:hypothetical protein
VVEEIRSLHSRPVVVEEGYCSHRVQLVVVVVHILEDRHRVVRTVAAMEEGSLDCILGVDIQAVVSVTEGGSHNHQADLDAAASRSRLAQDRRTSQEMSLGMLDRKYAVVCVVRECCG